MKNYISVFNKTIKSVKTDELLKMELKKPNIQRILVKKKVDDILNYQLKYLKENNRTNFLGVLTINYCLSDNNYYLIDGQHRYKAILILYDNHSHNLDIFIEIINVKDFNELRDNYNIINNSTPLPEFSIEVDNTILEESVNIFQNRYLNLNIWSKTSKCRRPHIYFNYFRESLAYIIEKLGIKNSKILVDMVENFNKELMHKSIDDYNNISEKQFELAKKWNFYLGLYSHCTNNNYGYLWAKEIVDLSFKENSNKVKKKINIPKKLRDDCWNKNIGKSRGAVYCIVCNIEKIYMNKFEAGHIVSEKNGGSLILENLIPICSGCNRSMGANNMTDWVKTFYPENLSKFSKRQYTNIVEEKKRKKIFNIF